MAHVLANRTPPARPLSLVLRFDEALGLLIGLLLPLAAAMLYHPYTLAVSPAWLEITRQLGLPYVLGEIGLILYAGRRGLDLAGLVGALPPATRAALIMFVATFWISSVVVSPRASFSVALCLIWLIHLCAGAAVFHLARDGGFAPRGLGNGLAMGLAALAAIAACHLYFPPPGFGFSTWKFGAPIPGFISSRLFGAWAGAAATLAIGAVWRAEIAGDRTRRLYPALCLAAGLVAWTGTRAALVGGMVALAAAVLSSRTIGPRRFWGRSIAAVIVGSLLAVLLMPAMPGGLWIREGVFASADTFASGRLTLWLKTLAIAVQRPMLGHGMGANWWLVSLQGTFHVQPHNALVEFFMNWGLVPTVPAVALLATATWQVHGKARRHPSLLPMVMAIDYLLAASMLDGMLHFSEFVMLVVILFGACLGVRGGDADPARIGRPTDQPADVSRVSNARLRSNP